MIDVVFLLIIFFLVSSHLAKQEHHIKLDLPSARSGIDEIDRVETVVVNVLADGTWQIAGRVIGEEYLQEYISKKVQASSEPIRLKIRTDKVVQYRFLSPILKQAAQAGIGDIKFSVREDRNS
ncbi:MAG: biopolymer transporter ExbD [Planctomycetales bacterium]|nr:biopolymer transporter ExbD [Planctomycetales bacterium]